MKAIPKIKWVNQNPVGQADERGYWRSLEGRFRISPNYRHTIYPDSYTVVDTVECARAVTAGTAGWRHGERSFDTVRECKQYAQGIVERHVMDDV